MAGQDFLPGESRFDFLLCDFLLLSLCFLADDFLFFLSLCFYFDFFYGNQPATKGMPLGPESGFGYCIQLLSQQLGIIDCQSTLFSLTFLSNSLKNSSSSKSCWVNFYGGEAEGCLICYCNWFYFGLMLFKSDVCLYPASLDLLFSLCLQAAVNY
ncbi:hypothetical protein FGO68_gene2447 [Halteria grandinella]|uniref:Uncharacterized protein n=1 Tax=Halteria grandinella TaxID=5974 RepID=A0A8J8NY57_HALGN|nr:hypothetical protein FGO68_gene2447 [Halteria grandinella]